MRTYTKDVGAIRYLINQDACKACGACVRACPNGAIDGERKKFYRISDAECRKCGICEGACKHNAIVFSTAQIGLMRPEESPGDYKRDFYQKLRVNISRWRNSKKGRNWKWTKYLMIAPDLFHLLFRTMLDGYVPLYEKVKLSLAVAYFVSPIDLLSELVMGPIGYVDDVALAAYVLHNLLNNIDPQIVMKYWAGDENLLRTLKHIMADTELMVTTGMWRKLKMIVG